MTHHIHIAFIPTQGALKPFEAAVYLGVSTATLRRLKSLPKSNPRRIRQTSYGTYPVSELDRHLTVEVQRA